MPNEKNLVSIGDRTTEEQRKNNGPLPPLVDERPAYPAGCQVAPGIYRLAVAGDEGGTMFDYKGKRWRDLAARAMRRDGYMCQLSKRYGKQMPAELVHHIYPVDDYPEYAYCLWNLISLSRAVHNTLHDRNTDKLTAEGIALMRRTKPK